MTFEINARKQVSQRIVYANERVVLTDFVRVGLEVGGPAKQSSKSQRMPINVPVELNFLLCACNMACKISEDLAM
jgi:hypothetical protein